MKWNRKWAVCALLLAAGVAAKADLARWIQDIPSPSQLQVVFFRAMSLPGGPIEVRRPPKETRAELARLIAASPSQADLYALRAHEDELQLDFSAAENDWKKYAELAADHVQANLSLADYYHRRIQPTEEIAALEAVGKAAASPNQRYKPASEQQSWKAFQQIQNVIEEQALSPDLSLTEYRAWVARYPSEPELHKNFFRAMVAGKRFAEAQNVLADYRRAFPSDQDFPIQAQATLASEQGSIADALAIYDRSFRPLWPDSLISSYFELLKQNHQLRTFLEQARSQIASKPADIAAVARVYYYNAQSKNEAGALRVLYEYRQRKESGKSPLTAEEAWTLGRLFEEAHNYDEAARSYIALYNLAGNANVRRAMAAIANLLLAAPDQPIRFGSGDLSYYRDVATLDPGPGYLNGVLSLIFNSTGPQYSYATENQASASYFHRAKASELIAQLDQRFPDATERPALHDKLIAAYVTYGDNDGVLRAGRQFLSQFPKARERTSVALSMADAYARQDKPKEEFTIYDGLLKELAAGADNMPLGEQAVAHLPAESAAEQPQVGARSAEYARVLDHYVGRLVALHRTKDALALYRREIDRNPNDPGLYERLAGFLDQNKMGADLEQVYRKAMTQFQDRSWSHKLARWYLRGKQVGQFDMLTRDVVKIFSGTELETYLAAVNQGEPLGPAFYRQVNLYAHQRFPNDLVFVQNLLTAYGNRGTADPAAREKLLRTYWFYAPDLRDRFFELLSRSGKLRAELAAIQKPDAATNPAAAKFLAEGEAWQGHFESAAPVFRAVAEQYPGDAGEQARAASMYRSLATFDASGNLKNTEIAASIEQNITKIAPRDSAALATVGDIFGDRELYQRAQPFWNRIAAVAPGHTDGYIEAATIHWDYYRFDEALHFIAEARQRLKQPQLFSYEAGAIYENRRDYARAVNEYASGALATPTADPQSRSRLVQLSRRTAEKQAIEDLTAKASTGGNATQSAVGLRIDVLTEQDRMDELRQFLAATAMSTSSADVLKTLDETAAMKGFENVQEQTRLRRIALATDPIERMQARIDIVHYYESHKNLPAAGGMIAELYKANPTVLGVVRASVDYYWRAKDSKRAVDILAEAAQKAQSSYRDSFRLEAARKSTEAADYSRARTLLAALLKDQPYRSEYVSAMADTYARQNDDKGLRDFYSDRLKTLQQASLPTSEKVGKTAAIRRGLIPVLTRLKDYSGAVDQYIEVLNRFPEDADLAREVANYAASHGRSTQLVDYYQNTRKQSPRDFRWAMVEARLQVQLEHFPAAVAAYQQAAELRPDRLDFYSDRAGLEERLLRFEEAAATYAKLYELSYHNNTWEGKLAEIRARQGRTDEAVKALTAAYLVGSSPTSQSYFAVAEKLEAWGLAPLAKPYVEKGANVAGNDLLAYPIDAQTYVRVLTKLHQYDAAYQKLQALTGDKPLDPSIVQAMGWAVAQVFTPEEKVAFAAFAAPKSDVLLPAIQKAGLLDVAARALAKEPDPLTQLQQRRLQFGELAAQLEAYWKSLPSDASNRDSYLQLAARNYRLAGDAAAELRLVTLLRNQLPERYAELMARSPQLDAVVSSNPSRELRNKIANHVLRTGPAQRALQLVALRGKGETALWSRAYLGLTGFYFGVNSAQVNNAFLEALGPATIGERLGKEVDRNQQLAGDLWFYYGSRYGEYLGLTKLGDAEDYLPSAVEARPGSADAYYQLAEYYRTSNQIEAAMAEYRNALQLDAVRMDALERIAAILAKQGKRDEAIAQFRAVMNAAARQLRERHSSPTFADDLQQTIEDIGKAKLLDPLRADVDRVLRSYIRANGNFRIDGVMQAVLAAAGDPAGVTWVIEMSRSAPDPSVFLSGEVNADWVPDAQRGAIYRAIIDNTPTTPDREQELRNKQIEYATYLVDHKHAGEAASLLATIPKEARELRIGLIIPLEARIAAQMNTLAAFLERFSANLEEIRNAATALQESGDHASSRQLLEFVYTRQLEAHEYGPSTFLGLAEIKLERGDTEGAVTLLRRMTMITGEPFETLLDAAALLTQTGHSKEAAPFLEQRVKAVPWDVAARVQLAKAHSNTAEMKTIAETNGLPYESRAEAARSIGELKGTPLTGGVPLELVVLSSFPITPSAAEKPYFYFARVAAAFQTNDLGTKIRLLRGAIAIDPDRQPLKPDLIRAALNAKRWQLAVSANSPPTPDKTLARGLAQAHEALGNLVEAQSLYRIAGDERDAKRLEIVQQREAQNALRRPVIKQELEQDRLVRPRLTAVNGGAQ